MIPIIAVRKVGVAVPHLVTLVTDEQVSPCSKHWPTVRVVGHSKQLFLYVEFPWLSSGRAGERKEEGVFRCNIATFACRARPGDVSESSAYIA